MFDTIFTMNSKSMGQLPVVNLNEIEDDDFLLFWDKNAVPSERALLIADSSTKVVRVGDLKKYINNYGTNVS